MKTALIALVTFSASLLALPAAAGEGPSPQSPKSNFIQRAKILSRNELGITISHSDRGKEIAFKWADEHCSSVGKLAVYASGAAQTGPNTISTWRCV